MTNVYGEEPTPRNVGLLDAAVRFLVGPLLIVAAGWGVATLDPDWLLTLIHPVILGLYLLLTAAMRTDLLYLATGIDTRREGEPRRRHHRAGRGRAS